jgi:hypothetical protein
MPLRPERGWGRADAGVIVNASSRLVVRGNANRVGTEPDGEPGRTTWLEATRLKGDVTGIDWLGTFGTADGEDESPPRCILASAMAGDAQFSRFFLNMRRCRAT